MCFDRIKSYDLQERLSRESDRTFKRYCDLSKEEQKKWPQDYCRTDCSGMIVSLRLYLNE